MTTILITGVAGLLGSRLADWIIDNKPEYNVIGIDDLSGGFKEHIHPKVTFFKLNLVEDPIETIFKTHAIDYVYHFAAYAAEGLSPFIRGFNYDHNLKATAIIVNQCIMYGVKRLIFSSSLAVYGHGDQQVFDEAQIPAPIDPYGVAKYASEMDIQIAGVQHNLDWCIIRPHNVYGIKQNIWDKYRNVLGIWMRQQLTNQPMSIYGSGLQTRAFSFIDDSLEPLFNAAFEQKASKQIINLGGIEEHRIIDANKILKNIIKKDTGKSPKTIQLQARHEVTHSIPTFQKSIDILGFKYITPMEIGLKKCGIGQKSNLIER